MKLENTILTNVVEDVQKAAGSALGSYEGIYYSVVAPLGLYHKLPVPSCLVNHVTRIADEFESTNHWEDASELYLWLLQVYRFDKANSVGIQAVAYTRLAKG